MSKEVNSRFSLLLINEKMQEGISIITCNLFNYIDLTVATNIVRLNILQSTKISHNCCIF